MAVDKKVNEYTTFIFEWHTLPYENIQVIGKKMRALYKHMRVTYFNKRVKYEDMRELLFT